jgi:hypothetical protein
MFRSVGRLSLASVARLVGGGWQPTGQGFARKMGTTSVWFTAQAEGGGQKNMDVEIDEIFDDDNYDGDRPEQADDNDGDDRGRGYGGSGGDGRDDSMVLPPQRRYRTGYGYTLVF